MTGINLTVSGGLTAFGLRQTTLGAGMAATPAWDEALLLAINHAASPALDVAMRLAAARLTWLPLYLLLVVVLVRLHGWRWLWWLLPVCLLIVATDQSANFAKHYFERLRPCHEPSIALQLRLLPGICGGRYGFWSAHAANSAGLLALLWPFFAGRWAGVRWVLAGWALLLAYCRVYLGVHYPSDVLTGAAVGLLVGGGLYKFFYQFALWRGGRA